MATYRLYRPRWTASTLAIRLAPASSLPPPGDHHGLLPDTATQPTITRVLDELPHHAWVHLSCHGTQHLTDPIESGFWLIDEPLSIADLIEQHDRGSREPAFLSACHTAAGSPRVVDEAIHLAAAMQLLGYRHVITPSGRSTTPRHPTSPTLSMPPHDHRCAQRPPRHPGAAPRHQRTPRQVPHRTPRLGRLPAHRPIDVGDCSRLNTCRALHSHDQPVISQGGGSSLLPAVFSWRVASAGSSAASFVAKSR